MGNLIPGGTFFDRPALQISTAVHSIPPKANAEFVWKMEDVLVVYKRPYDPAFPLVCLDEASKQLVGEARMPVPAAPGQETRYDCEYVRNGVANLFMMFEPLAGWRRVRVTE